MLILSNLVFNINDHIFDINYQFNLELLHKYISEMGKNIYYMFSEGTGLL